MKTTEEASEGKDMRIEELQRFLGGMKQESATLREAIRSREEELLQLRKIREEGQKGDQRSAYTHTHTQNLLLDHWQSNHSCAKQKMTVWII